MQLLGFPIQLVGLLSLPYLGVRYLAEGADFQSDIKTAAVSLAGRGNSSLTFVLLLHVFITHVAALRVHVLSMIQRHECSLQGSVTKRLPGLEK